MNKELEKIKINKRIQGVCRTCDTVAMFDASVKCQDCPFQVRQLGRSSVEHLNAAALGEWHPSSVPIIDALYINEKPNPVFDVANKKGNPFGDNSIPKSWFYYMLDNPELTRFPKSHTLHHRDGNHTNDSKGNHELITHYEHRMHHKDEKIAKRREKYGDPKEPIRTNQVSHSCIVRFLEQEVLYQPLGEEVIYYIKDIKRYFKHFGSIGINVDNSLLLIFDEMIEYLNGKGLSDIISIKFVNDDSISISHDIPGNYSLDEEEKDNRSLEEIIADAREEEEMSHDFDWTIGSDDDPDNPVEFPFEEGNLSEEDIMRCKDAPPEFEWCIDEKSMLDANLIRDRWED